MSSKDIIRHDLKIMGVELSEEGKLGLEKLPDTFNQFMEQFEARADALVAEYGSEQLKKTDRNSAALF